MKNLVLSVAAAALLSATACEKAADTNIDPVEAQAQEILSQMTLEEKVGQVLQADISAVTPEEARQYNLGSILNGGNSAPGGGVVAEPSEWIALADSYWLASTDTSDGGLGIPLLWGTDAVHGHNNLQYATIFPHNIGLGATRNPDLIRQIADVKAREVRATGVDWTFAPTLAVAQDDRWGRAYESYAEDPDVVAAFASAMVLGLQGEPSEDNFLVGDNVIATAKHFLGDGGTQLGIDKGDTQGEMDMIVELHGAGYPPAIDAGAQTVMASFSSVNGEKMHGHEYLLTDVLRGQMGFEGFVVGDWNGHGEVPGCTNTDCPEALIAGIDMYMAPDSWKGLYDNLLAQAQSGELPMEALDRAVTNILEVKIRAGLMEAGLPSERAGTDPALLGADEHRAIARQAVRESLVLLKNDGGVLPLSPAANILVTGSGADSMQQQTGGWTLSWQGDDNANDAFKTGSTIFAGLDAAAGDVTLSPDGSFETAPDVAVVVFGEQPYAEYRGDRSHLVYEFEDGENLALIKSFKDQGIPVVSVFISGRPMWVNPHLNASDAFVAAWLPGTEGAGIADVLVANTSGDARYDFSGKLSFSWPSDGTGTPITAESETGVLFPYGYGLTYADTPQWDELDENPGVARSDALFDGSIFERGDPAGSLSLYVGDSSNRNTPISGLSGQSLGGAVSVSGTDYQAQEDSRRIVWSGEGTVSVRPSGMLDLTRMGEIETLGIQMTLQVNKASDSLKVGVACGEACEAETALGPWIGSAGEWMTVTVPLSCLSGDRFDPAEVSSVMYLESESAADIALHNAALVELTDAPVSCPN